MTLPARLLLLVSLALLPPLAIQAWSSFDARREREAALQNEAVAESREVQASLVHLAEGIRQLLVALAEVPAIRAADPAGCTAYLQAIARNFPEYILLAANDADGIVICSSAGVQRAAYSNAGRAYHQRALATRRFATGDLVTGVVTQRRSIHFALPFAALPQAAPPQAAPPQAAPPQAAPPQAAAQPPTPAGIVIASVDQERITRQITEVSLPPSAIGLVIDPAGTIIAATRDGKPLGEGWVGATAPPTLLAALRVPAPATFEHPGLDNRTRLFGAVPPDPVLGGMLVAVGLDREAALAEVAEVTWRNLASLALGATLALAAGMLGARRFVIAPLARLANAADRVRMGELGARADLGRRATDLREVGDAFDRMSAALATREAERDRAEQARQVGESRLARLLDTTPAGVVELDATGRIAYVNAAAGRILGAAPGVLVGRRYDEPDWRIAATDDTPVPPGRMLSARALAGETVLGVEQTLQAIDGRRVALLFDIAPIRDQTGAITGALAAFQDVSERHQTIAALRKSEAEFRAVAELVPDLLWRSDANGHMRWVNQRWLDYTGMRPDQVTNEAVIDVIHPDEREISRTMKRQALETGQSLRIEHRIRAADGTYRWFLARAEPLRDPDTNLSHGAAPILQWFGSATDIDAQIQARQGFARSAEELEARVASRTAELSRTLEQLHDEVAERERAQDALRQSQKMEAVGQLTGGIAHDFNNMLQAIGGSLDLMQRRIAQGRAEDGLRHVHSAQRAVQRAAALTHRLLAFARRQALQPRPVDAHTLLAGIEDLLRRTVGPAIHLERHADPRPATVLCDPNQLENALLNLAINARDAMPEGGRLTLTTTPVHLLAPTDVNPTEPNPGRPGPEHPTLRLTPAECEGPDRAAPGQYIAIAVADTGCGMDEATAARAFEPFFTTKPIGQGTGLGLSQLYGFVRQSGGLVRLQSHPGRGTTIQLLLPRHDTDATSPLPQPAEPTPRGAETLLLVEDEATIRTVAAEHLADLGYTVLQATDGPEALDILQPTARTIHLLLTDVGLPGPVNGRQVADAARTHRPHLPVLFITGYAGTALERLEPGMHVIAKPFDLEHLATRIRDLLDARPGP